MTINNPCQKHNCSVCCKPVKMGRGFKVHQGTKFEKSPFKERDEYWRPTTSTDTTALEVYDCINHDPQTGLCKDYENRPDVCKNTECPAFQEEDEEKQRKIVAEINKQEFFICGKK